MIGLCTFLQILNIYFVRCVAGQIGGQGVIGERTTQETFRFMSSTQTKFW